MEVSYALWTEMTVVKSLGDPGMRFVKINSNRVLLHFVRTYKASVWPRSFDWAVFVEMLMTQLKPIERFTLGKAKECHIILRFVTIKRPRSPLFPLVSSTAFNASINFSPGRIFICCGLISKRTSLSSHSPSDAILTLFRWWRFKKKDRLFRKVPPMQKSSWYKKINKFKTKNILEIQELLFIIFIKWFFYVFSYFFPETVIFFQNTLYLEIRTKEAFSLVSYLCHPIITVLTKRYSAKSAGPDQGEKFEDETSWSW